MAEIKVVINTKDGKSYQTNVDEMLLIGKKIGNKVSDLPNLAGYELEITGGSDKCGFPMRKDIEGIGRKKILTTDTVGVRVKDKGLRIRKNVAGNTINDQTSQVNMKVIKEGTKKLNEMFKKESEEEKVEEKKEIPKEKKEEPKKEVKVKEVKKEKPKKEMKEEKPKENIVEEIIDKVKKDVKEKPTEAMKGPTEEDIKQTEQFVKDLTDKKISKEGKKPEKKEVKNKSVA